MNKSKVLVFIYTFLIVLCVAFVSIAAQNLPPVVASHFDLSGTPDATMPRDQFTKLFLAIMVLTSGSMALLPMLIAKLPPQMINIPNRMYWLAPDRIVETKQILQAYLLIFASKLCCFMAVIFWLIVQAHLHNPPQLSTQYVMAATGVFVLMTILWSLKLSARFKIV
jgi:serine/threonine-protein kinase